MSRLIPPSRRGLLTGATALAVMTSLPQDAEAGAQSLLGLGRGSVGGSALTWNNTAVPTNDVLSNGDHTVTTFSSSFSNQRANVALSGKQFCEITINVRGAAFSMGPGVMDASAILNGAYLGFDSHNGGMYDDGHVWISNTQTCIEVGVALAGLTVVCATNATTKKWWCFVPVVGWCGSSGADDPLTGTGGLDYSALNSPAYYGVSLATNGDQATINGGSSPFSNTVQITALQAAGYSQAG